MNTLRKLIVFSLDGQRFALRLAVVERIEQMVEITRLPRMPEHVLGVVNRKGQIVPVFNLRRRFRLPERDVDPRDHLIFARTRYRPVALAVDAAGGVMEADGQNLIASDSVLPGLECIDGMAKTEGGLALIHDLDRFLSLDEETALTEAMKCHD